MKKILLLIFLLLLVVACSEKSKSNFSKSIKNPKKAFHKVWDRKK